MTDKLEEKLLQYEKNKSVSNKTELEEAINSIIESELSNPDDLVDFDLIDEATEFLLYLDGKEDNEFDNEINRITDSIIQKSRNKESPVKEHILTNEQRVKKTGVRKKWIIPLVAVISILAAIIITCYAFGLDLISMTKSVFLSLKPQTEYTDGTHDVIVTESARKYKTLDEISDVHKQDGEVLL